MIGPRDPFEPARRPALRAELVERGRTWLRDWRPRESRDDFAGALFEIAARLESEVTQRLDRIPEKVFRGFLHWLGVRPKAGRAARLPVVFTLTAGAEPVLAHKGIQLQATPAPTDTGAAPEPVTFETADDLMVSRGRLAVVVGAEPRQDTFFLPPHGHGTLAPPAPRPLEWRPKSEARAGASQLQLEPELGLDSLPTLLHMAADPPAQYRVVKAEGALATIEPPLETNVGDEDVFRLAAEFDPFSPSERNRQEHAVYVGSESLLNLPTAATIAVSWAGESLGDAEWAYWGKVDGRDDVDWQPLTPPKDGGPGLLAKQAGAVEMRDIGGTTSRWLRARRVAQAGLKTLSGSKLQLTVNCTAKGTSATCPPPEPSTVVVEAIANTTPLVLNEAFFPLGPEPKLFDAFYVGCPEAFSKANADVSICFKALDGTTTSWTAAQIGGSANNLMLFGIGSDGNLHSLKTTGEPTRPVARQAPVRPPFNGTGTASVNAQPATLSAQPRLTTVTAGDSAVVAALGGPAATDVWLWQQRDTPAQCRWFQAGTLPAVATPPPAPPSGKGVAHSVVLLQDGGGLHVVGLNEGSLFELPLPQGVDTLGAPAWRSVDLPPQWTGLQWVHIAPVFNRQAPPIGARLTDGWIAVSGTGKVLLFTKGPQGSTLKKELVLDGIETTAIPLAIRSDPAAAVDPGILLVVAQKTPDVIKAWQIAYDQVPTAPTTNRMENVVVHGGSFAWADSQNNDIAIVFTRIAASGSPEIDAWFPFSSGTADPDTLYRSPALPPTNGAPGVVPGTAVIPGGRGDVHTLAFDANSLATTDVPAVSVSSAVVIETDQPPRIDFAIVTPKVGAPILQKITATPQRQEGADRFWVALPNSDGARLFKAPTAYEKRPSDEFTPSNPTSTGNETTFDLDNHDHTTAAKGDLIVFMQDDTLSLHEVTTPPGTLRTVTVTPKVKPAVPAPASIAYCYVREVTHPTSIKPLIDVPGTTLPEDRIHALQANGAFFAGAKPQPNLALFFQPVAAPFGVAILAENWTKAPTKTGANFIVVTNEIFGARVTIADVKTTNPKLSWEYWDGQAWWKIERLVDGTSSLRTTGVVSFCVPPELKPTDVVGRTSHWIRARLISGDYGQEQVTIKSLETPGNPKVTTQTVVRSLAGITPPQLASIDVGYAVCCPSDPDYVMTLDGGRLRDQTAANTIPDARVELFAPLTESIRRAASLAADAADYDGPAIYLGFDAKVEGGPISVLFLVKEGQHDGAFPLRADVLRARGFERVLVEDETRGLNESGIVRFSVGAAPPEVALFGNDARCWLRLRPNPEFTDPWRPGIRAAFLNGTWAVAGETQDLERLGSSDGSPSQRVVLARPPVLEDSLELRINERLGEEEVDHLLAADSTAVLTELNGLSGTWVRWKEVADPADGDPGDRVFALEHATGVITFGDGQRGRIPPIGQDSIVARSYKRGGGSAANRVTAWSQLNLITPIPGVESVQAPEDAAGGSDSQATADVIRFAPSNQFMRDRALTLRDFEMLAAQFSPDIAQARAFGRRDGIDVVVAVRGRDPRPSERVLREMARYLTERTTPMLSAHGVLTPKAPTVVDARIELRLTVDEVEHTGAVEKEIRARIASLLDPASGGLDKSGWLLGSVPTDADVAAVLDGVPHLLELLSVRVVDPETGVELRQVGPRQLVAPDAGLALQFEIAQEGAA